MGRHVLRAITWVPMGLCFVLLLPQLIVLHGFAFVCEALSEIEAETEPGSAIEPTMSASLTTSASAICHPV